jgi:rhodanese-related sulfurtransferase
MTQIKKREFKTQIYEQFARITTALANARRLELLEILAQGECPVEKLAMETEMSMANVSQHLKILRSARLVEIRRQGTYIFYRLADEQVFKAWQAIRTLGQARLTEIERIVHSFLTEREIFKPIHIKELNEILQNDNVILIDVRPKEEYDAGHIPGARSIPLETLERVLETLPVGKEIIAYCRGPYCIFSDQAIRILKDNGFEARRLEEGMPDWKALNLPVDTEVQK